VVRAGSTSTVSGQGRPQAQPAQQLDASNTDAVVLFFHIPKTGGSSFVNFMMQSGFVYYSARSVSSTNDALKGIANRTWPLHPYVNPCTEGGRKRYSTAGYPTDASSMAPLCTPTPRKRLLELHMVPGFVPFANIWHAARTAMRAHGIPTVAFTLLRDPVDLTLSHFNFVCGPSSQEKKVCPPHDRASSSQPRRPHTASEMIAWTPRNPQCATLYTGWKGWGRVYTTYFEGPDEHTCHKVLNETRVAMDFIGDTARFDEVLAQVKARLTAVNTAVLTSKAKSNWGKADPNLQRSELTTAEVKALYRLHASDTSMYRHQFHVQEALPLHASGSS
jgi:hypothetical protein